MTSNKEFISQTQETLAKMSASKAPPQFNSHKGPSRKILGTKENETVHISINKKASSSLVQKQNSNTEVLK